ncbi:MULTISPECIES: glycosyltransferase [Colwellia]|uniref:Glycosyl transferase n=1 Tax=Colwellia marinimaniae TaxID=1513592 RepID=A0ABQ0MT53_9GAMM|nr:MULTISPECIES: glycosyltransferase family A protein [Colwellia]GAW95543.1 glycosyl transferase [Colwellia marinimaniae]
MTKNKHVSFIIPHKGREELLIQTVTSILNQSDEQATYDIIVVSQNKSLIELSKLAEQHSNVIISFQEDSLTISALRNVGAAKSTGEYLAFLDADVELSSNWLNAMLSTIDEQNNCVLASAAQANSKNAPALEKIRTALSNADLDCNVSFLPGRNLFLSRKIFEKVNGFPEHLITCEDYYFTDQVNQLGNLYYTSAATYVHLGEDKKYKEMYKKEIWRGQSNLQSISGRDIPLREIPSFIIPISLPILLIIFLGAIFISNMELALLALFSFLLPFALYSLRLYKLVRKEISFWRVLQFYVTYFPARVIGTLAGLFKSFSSSNVK